MRLENIDFLIVGAAKSATTWLQRSLQADHGICMPNPEVHYFSREFERGDEWYLAQFPEGAEHRLVGEKSNSYLDCPRSPSRIRRKLPNVKIVAQLRNPVDRAYSDYCMLYRRGEVGRNIDQYLDPRKAGNSRFLEGGLYYSQLQRYLERYPANRILILLYEDFRADPQRQLDLTRAFLGLGPARPSDLISEKVKDRSQPIVGLPLRRVLKPLKPMVAPMRHNGAFKAARRLIARQPNYPPLGDGLRERLAEHYFREVESLGSLLERDLSSWLDPLAPTSREDHSLQNTGASS